MNGVSNFASPRNVKPCYSSRSPLPYSLLRNTIRVDISQISTSCAGLKTRYYNEFSHSIG